jgi:adenylate/nucleoside-diphosphate kinase
MLCIHIDGKQVTHLDEDTNITITTERIAVSITSPDLAETDDILLGVVKSSSSKGEDQAECVLDLLLFFDIQPEQIFAICDDTTASNTGRYIGANVILAEILQKSLAWFMCRRHILEVHVSRFMEALTGVKTKGPRREIYLRLKNAWPSLKPKLEACLKEPGNKDLVKFNWKSLTVGSDLYNLAVEARTFGKTALKTYTFERGDYRKMIELAVYYLTPEDVHWNFSFHQPGACHEARYNF